MMQASLSNYSVHELIEEGFKTFKEGAREAGRYFDEAEEREPGSIQRFCREYGGDFRDATRAMNWYRAYAGEEHVVTDLAPVKPKVTPYERALKAFLRLSPAEKKSLLEHGLLILEGS